MKKRKLYVAPTMKVVELKVESILLDASKTPTFSTESVTTLGTDDEEAPISGSYGNAKQSSLWDDEDE